MQQESLRISGSGEVAHHEPSVGGAVERLLTASQGVVTKRIDLALLEAQEIMTHGLESVFLLALNLVWIAAAWVAFAVWLITVLFGDQSFANRTAAFGVLNAAAALLGMLMIRHWVMPRKEKD